MGPTPLPARIASKSPLGTGHDEGCGSTVVAPGTPGFGATVALGAVAAGGCADIAACSLLSHVHPAAPRAAANIKRLAFICPRIPAREACADRPRRPCSSR